ncbi:MAG: four helix bundle protein [Chthonomonadaceae bacterium]|nr:four helix bundle protein [Chthonomonadaceae bacterium]
MGSATTFKDLHVWQTSMDLAREVYRVTRDLPRTEVFGLTSQIRRAAVSVPSNIAEGNGRQHPKEYVQCLSIAMGSLREVETLWILCQELLPHAERSRMDELLDQTGRMLNRLRATIRAKI